MDCLGGFGLRVMYWIRLCVWVVALIRVIVKVLGTSWGGVVGEGVLLLLLLSACVFFEDARYAVSPLSGLKAWRCKLGEWSLF